MSARCRLCWWWRTQSKRRAAFAALIAQARAANLSYGSAGPGTTMNIAGELMNAIVGIKTTHVPYRGAGPALNDLLGGHLDLIVADTPVLLPLVNSHAVRPLALFAPQRSPLVPDVPTTAELGYPQIVMENWYGVFAPAGLPAPLRARLEKALLDVIAAPVVKERFDAGGLSAADGRRRLRDEACRRRRLLGPGGEKARDQRGMTASSMRCDSHVHVIGPIDEIPAAGDADLSRAAGLARRTSRQRRAERHFERFVIVQPSFYGADNTVLLETLDALGPRGRGVAVIDPAQTSKAMLDGYAARGVCGLRINLYSPGKASGGRLARDFAAMADLATAMGWHVEVIAPIAILAETARAARTRTDVTVVIDHYGVYGHATPDKRRRTRPCWTLLGLPHVWMKLSAPYRVCDDPLNTRPDPAWLAAILDRARERCVWGSDWPHTPGHDAQHGPDVAGVYRPLHYKTLVDDFIARAWLRRTDGDDHERQSDAALRVRRVTASRA